MLTSKDLERLIQFCDDLELGPIGKFVDLLTSEIPALVERIQTLEKENGEWRTTAKVLTEERDQARKEVMSLQQGLDSTRERLL